MKKLLANSESFYSPQRRPSGHDISSKFDKDNGGSIPSNLISIPNTESNSQYISTCKKLDIKPHPARFPRKLPEFFIKFLTLEEDIVLDFFAGSNTTGEAAESLNRNWVAIESDKHYCAASAFRFLSEDESPEEIYTALLQNESLFIGSRTLFSQDISNPATN